MNVCELGKKMGPSAFWLVDLDLIGGYTEFIFKQITMHFHPNITFCTLTHVSHVSCAWFFGKLASDINIELHVVGYIHSEPKFIRCTMRIEAYLMKDK